LLRGANDSKRNSNDVPERKRMSLDIISY
jgi:hypothetical protein